jgi:hypothetical protein
MGVRTRLAATIMVDVCEKADAVIKAVTISLSSIAFISIFYPVQSAVSKKKGNHGPRGRHHANRR